LKVWPRLLRHGSVSSRTFHIQRLKFRPDSTIHTYVTSSQAASASQLEGKELVSDDFENENKSNNQKRSLHNQRQHREYLDRQLYKLDMDVRRSGRALPFDLDMIMEFVKKWQLVTSNQALLLLRCCGWVLSDEKAEARTERAKVYWKTFQDYGVAFDVSHYNALLKVHLENEHKIVPSDFLADMEEQGVDPNRVTFQHMIGLYCLDGNITGATTILEHMKSQDMAINDSVFHSLLRGHCINNDQESVDATLDIMKSSGLDLGTEAVTVMAVAHAKAGRWQKVQDILSQAEEKDVKLNDGDIFQIVVGLCEAGLETEAQEMLKSLPRRRGYFQEMRSAIPQIIFTGCVDVALDVFLSFKVLPARVSNDEHDETNRKDKGAFVIRAMAKSEVDPEKVLRVLDVMKEAGYSDWLGLLVEAAAKFSSEEYCHKLGEFLSEKRGGNFLDKTEMFNFLRKEVNAVKRDDPEKIFEFLNKLRALRLRIPLENFSNDIFPSLIDIEKETPVEVCRRLRDAVPSCSWSFLCNSMIQSLLNREKLSHFQSCTGFLLNAKIGSMYGNWWNASLARSYLTTNSVDDLISILFVASRPENQMTPMREGSGPKEVEMLFRCLNQIVTLQYRYRSEETKDDVLRPVVHELVRHHIGMPRETADNLKNSLEDTALKELLDDAVAEFEGYDWTEEKTAEMMKKRKDIWAKQTGRRGSPKPRTMDYKMDYKWISEIPDDIAEMENIKNILDKRGETNNLLTSRYIQKLAKSGQVEKSIELLKTAQETGFNGNPTLINDIIVNLLSEGKFDQAIQFFKTREENGAGVFLTSYLAILINLAMAGKHTTVLDLLGEETGNLLNNRNYASANSLLDVYCKAGDVENLKTVFTTLDQQGFIDRNDAKAFSKLVEVHLVKGDYSAAVAEFERIAHEHKKMTYKFQLMERLIEEENMEDMQKVLDISIELIGEEKSLYDLAHNFLSSGKRAQAKKLLETPGLRYHELKMKYIVDRLIQDGKREAVEDLVMLSKNLFGCDRDFLFVELVQAYRNDASKALEIWINIQEEGHAPSDGLKRKIAEVLQAGGRPVPFEIPDQVVKPVETRNQVKDNRMSQEPRMGAEYKLVKESVAKQSNAKPKDNKIQDDNNLIQALETGDTDTVKAALSTLNTSTKLYVLNKLVTAEKLENACTLFEELVKSGILNRNGMSPLLQKLKEVGDIEKLNSLNEGLPKKAKHVFKSGTLLTATKALHKPQEYLKLLTNSTPDDRSWAIPGPLIVEAIEKNKQLGEDLATLALDGNERAAIILGRAAVETENKQEFKKFWNLVGDKEYASKDTLGYNGSFRPYEKLEWAIGLLKELSAPKEAFKYPYNSHMTLLKDTGRKNEVLAEALGNSVSLEDIDDRVLKVLCNEVPDFALRSKALEIIEQKSN